MHLAIVAPPLTSARLAICVGKRTLWNCSDVSPGCGSENGRGRTQRRPHRQRLVGWFPNDTDLGGQEPRQERPARGRFLRCCFPYSGTLRESRGRQPGLAHPEPREDAASVGYEAVGPAAEWRRGFCQPWRYRCRSTQDEKGEWDYLFPMAAISSMLLDHHVAPRRNESSLGKLALYDDANRLAGPKAVWAVNVNAFNNGFWC